ncbi:Nitrilase/cyanide hydratase and apolipoprotein N-acyltransferase [Botryosphaeria dothidea]|uniref:nitrilase n=1 Tax=Botryosphaeria dothidea TaxID=55169 RepID=A0A8H4IZ51_9PEZI|nr:Nitrilase/cyanide hydratase and apolipoprotein N-acyltransferase [Botryosphaeria dothidea]KAF4311972.1 Nitrilase/cyanide hydratase and apolipoprotein N-acyltransferase [Botryosphaeria dothidea]
MKLTSVMLPSVAIIATFMASSAGPALVQWANSLTNKSSSENAHEIVSRWDITNLAVAAVRRAPVNWPMPMMNKNWTGVSLDLNATVDLGVSLIEEAALNGVRVIGFPEVWFPGYPKARPGVINDADPNLWFQYHVKDYIENSLAVGSQHWNKLVQAAIDNEIYVGLSFSEKDNTRLYMAQSLIAPDGEVLIHRHKLRPSAQERELWSDGKLDHVYAVSTEDIHIGSWPMTPDFGNGSLTYESSEVITSLGRIYAVLGDTAVIQASIGVGTIFPSGSSAVWSQIVANVSFDDHPIVYRSFNASEFKNTTNKVDGELSWGTLQAVNEEFPEYIPQTAGDLVPWHQNLITDLLNRSVV